MKPHVLSICSVLLFAASLFGQNIRPNAGTSLPSTCTVGDLYFKSDATAGQNIYECAATNTWTQQLNTGGQVFNVKAYGAVGDERFLTDAAIGLGSTDLSSATAAFTSADTGKTVTVNAGPNAILTATYTSGATVTGSANQYCTVGTFNGGGSSAAGYLLLTGTNAIAGSTALDITNVGTGFTSAPTSAVLTNGTATCSGTITIATALIALPLVTTGTYVSATHLTLGAAATTAVTSARMSIGTDDSAAIQAAITAAAVSGGTVYFPPAKYLTLSQLTFPNDAGGQPTQAPVLMVGSGADYRAWINTNNAGAYYGTVLDMRYSGSGGKINTTAQGQLEISEMIMDDLGDDTTPYINTDHAGAPYSTTNLRVYDVVFTDNPRKNGAYGTANRTAIYIGPSLSGSISHNWFDRIQTGVFITNQANGIEVSHNYWTLLSGADLNSGALVLDALSAPGGAAAVQGNTIIGNSFEMENYAYGIRVNKANKNTIIGNEFQDSSGILLDFIRLASGSQNNVVITSYLSQFVSDLDGSNSIQTGLTKGTYLASLGVGTISIVTEPALFTSYLGFNAGNVATSTGAYNSALGNRALNSLTNGANNVAVGYQSMYGSTSGGANTAVGDVSLLTNTDGANNTAVGRQSAYSNNHGNNLTAVGHQALYQATGSQNTGLGEAAGYGITSGSENVYVGRYAGVSAANATVTAMVVVGNSATAKTDGDTNEIVIGNTTTGAGSNTAVIGNSSVTDVYLGSATPAAALHAAKLIETVSASPASNAACTAGTISWDANYIYVCTASGVVKRAALTGGY